MGWITGLFVVLISTSGAGFIWAFEKRVPSLRQHLPDRVHKLIYSSLIFAVLYAWPIYFVHTNYIRPEIHPPSWVWIGLIIGVVIPPTLGGIVGANWAHIKRNIDTNVPSVYNYILYSLARQKVNQKLVPLAMIHFIDTSNSPSIVVGHLRHVSETPYEQDAYLYPIYYYGPEEKVSIPGTILDKQSMGSLIPYARIVSIRVAFIPKTDKLIIHNP